MPQVIGSRTFAIPRVPTTTGPQWINDGGQFCLWRDNSGNIDSWYYKGVFIPGVASIVGAGLAPNLLNTGARIFAPGTASIVANGLAPSLLTKSTVFAPGTGSVSANGLAPILKTGTYFTPAQGSITIAGKPVGGWRVSWARVKIN